MSVRCSLFGRGDDWSLWRLGRDLVNLGCARDLRCELASSLRMVVLFVATEPPDSSCQVFPNARRRVTEKVPTYSNVWISGRVVVSDKLTVIAIQLLRVKPPRNK